MFAQLVSAYHPHPIVDHFTIALLTFGIAAEILSAAAILLSRGQSSFALGHYLMYAFLILAAWRVMLEWSSRLERTRIAFLIVEMVAAGALLYQGKTGGELVYEHGVGASQSHFQN